MKELTIEHIAGTKKSAARVRVRYRKDPTAQAQAREAEFRFSISAEQRQLLQWYLEEFLICPWEEFLSRASRAEELMKQLGEELFDAVFGNQETGALYAHVADNIHTTRIVIHAADPAGISFPWELLRDRTRGEYGDLARLAYTFVRSQPDLIFDTPSPQDRDTFNILMVICRPGGPEGDVPFQSVARPLLELFRRHRDRVHLDVLRPPTFEQLGRVLNEKAKFYKVLHFDGHGTFPQGSDQFQGTEQGCLLFEGEDGNPRQVTGEQLGGLLANKGIPIVLLNACQSGMTRPEVLYPSVGNQLLKAGSCGVVAMTYSIYVQAAVRFMARLYEGLVNGEELARAVTIARDELRLHPQRPSPIGDIELCDWMVPVLFEAAPIRVMPPGKEVHLDLAVLEDQPAKAGAEVDCPEMPAYGFIGRDGVTLDLETAFRTESVVLLQGMAGVGKTEMAMGFARWLAETGGLDGPIFFFKFENYLTLAQLYDRVGQVFHQAIRGQLGREWHLLDAGQQRHVAVEILGKIPCLMIWDNFEPARGFPQGTGSAWSSSEQDELRKFLIDLRGGKTKVLLTSRRDEDWLGKIYRCVKLDGLRLGEAQELALRVLRRAGLNVEQIRALPQYNDLLKYLRGNPLAIQVILPELQGTSPERLLDGLRRGEAKFAKENLKQGREHSLTASLSYRLDALDLTLRKRLGFLALFQGFVNANVLAFMCQKIKDPPELVKGMGRENWIAVLDSAAEMGLLRHVDEGLYALHPALPWFFHDLLCEAFPGHKQWLEGAFTATYGGYASSMHDIFDRNPETAISVLNAEEGNLLHALRLARKSERWEDVGGILDGIMRLLTTQGRWAEWERLVSSTEREVTDKQGQPLQGREKLWYALLAHRAEVLNNRHDLGGAEALYSRLKDFFENENDDRNVATTLHQLGTIAQKRGQLDVAERWYRQSLAIEKRIANRQGQASSLCNLGIIAQERGQLDVAERLFRESLVIEKEIGSKLSQAITLYQLGTIAQERDQLDEAERWYRKGLAITKRIGHEEGQANFLHQLGIIAQERDQLDEAERWYRQSLAIEKRIANRQGQASSLHQLGIIAQERDQLDEAERWYRQSLAIEKRIGHKGQASSLHQLGIIAHMRGELDEAERLYQESLSTGAQDDNKRGYALTLYQVGMIREKQGKAVEAVQLYEQAKAILEGLKDHHHLEMVRSALKRVRG